MSGETDLAAMLSSLHATRRPGTFVVVSVASDASVGPDGDQPNADLATHATAVVVEAEGTTYVLPSVLPPSVAPQLECTVESEWAWLTLEVHSSLSAVGLTAAVSTALAEAGIACNMLAGYYHDHLLVPAEAADDALATLAALRDDPRNGRS